MRVSFCLAKSSPAKTLTAADEKHPWPVTVTTVVQSPAEARRRLGVFNGNGRRDDLRLRQFESHPGMKNPQPGVSVRLEAFISAAPLA